MAQLTFGERNVFSFSSDNTFYESLGYLSNNNRGIRFDFESYANKWGIEGRIWITNAQNAPKELKAAFSAGTQGVDCRLNCNEFIAYLVNNFGFKMGSNNTYNDVVTYVPATYIVDFDRGYKL